MKTQVQKFAELSGIPYEELVVEVRFYPIIKLVELTKKI